MTHKLGDTFAYASWSRFNETSEEIAWRTFRFTEEFSFRVSVGRWRPAQQEEGKWDGTEAGLADFIESRIMRKNDGENAPEEGYHFLLETEDDLLEALFIMVTDRPEIPEPVHSPSFYQQFGWVPLPDPGQPPCVSVDFSWEVSIHTVTPTFDPDLAVGQEPDVIMEQGPEGQLLLIGYRMWINERVGGVRACVEGLTVGRLGNGTLIGVLDPWPAGHATETLAKTFRPNDLDGLL